MGIIRRFIGLGLILILVIVSVFFLGVARGSGALEEKMNNPYHPWLAMYAGQEKQISDRIVEDDVQVFRDRLIVMGDFYWSEYENTDSMLPLLDKGSNGIYEYVDEDTDLIIGDVVSYRPSGYSENYVHRIIDIGKDNQGAYFILKGDNNNLPDPFKVRKEEIKGVMVGIIW